LQFRAEAFSLINTPSFHLPSNNDYGDTLNFGESTTTRSSPREIQFALKYYWYPPGDILIPMYLKAPCWFRVVGMVFLVTHFATIATLGFESGPGAAPLAGLPRLQRRRAGPARHRETKPRRLRRAAALGRVLFAAKSLAGRHPGRQAPRDTQADQTRGCESGRSGLRTRRHAGTTNNREASLVSAERWYGSLG
jgi:hypothetical protein